MTILIKADLKRFPQASEGSEADCTTEQLAKVRRQMMGS